MTRGNYTCAKAVRFCERKAENGADEPGSRPRDGSEDRQHQETAKAGFLLAGGHIPLRLHEMR
jgi:hypothetical protein